MRKLFGFTLAFLTGCASDTVVSGLPQSMRLTPPGSPRYIVGEEFSYPAGPDSREKAHKCVVLNVSNRDVALGDSAGSFVGQASGRYYNIERRANAPGGSVTQYADDSGVVIANGRTQFASGILSRVLDYRVTVDASSPDNVRIDFTELATASVDTGSLRNNGFAQPGAWPGADPLAVHGALAGVADALASCLSR